MGQPLGEDLAKLGQSLRVPPPPDNIANGGEPCGKQ